MPTTGQTRRAQSQECKALLDVAGRSMFQDNAFRITGLPAHASNREITKHGERLKLQEELGNGAPPMTGVFARNPPPALDEIRAALQRLKNPEYRIVDEFLWFWPMSADSNLPDEAFAALQQGEVNQATAIWRKREADNDAAVIATHNLAVAYSLAALDLENGDIGKGRSEGESAKISRLWQSAVRRWLQIMDSDDLWSTVVERIRQLNEPNLPTGFARQMRQSLRVSLCKAHAELAVAYADEQQLGYARAQVTRIKRLSGETDAHELVAEMVLNPIINRLRQQIERARQKASDKAPNAADVARELFRQARDVIPKLSIFWDDNRPERAVLLDDVADAVNSLAIAHQSATNDDQGSLELLLEAQEWASTHDVIEKINKNVSVLTDNIAHAKLAPAYNILKSIQDSKASAHSRLQLFQSKAVPMLTFVTSELADTNSGKIQLFNAAAIVLREISVAAWNSEDDIAMAETAIQLALKYVRTAENKKRLLGDQKNLADIRAAQKAAIAEVEAKAKRDRNGKWMLAGVGGVILLVIIAGNSKPKVSPRPSPTPSYQSNTPPAYQPSPSARYSDGDGNTYSVPHAYTSELARDRAAIETQRTRVDQLEVQMDSLGRQIEQERSSVSNSSQYAVDEFNRKVNQYNALLTQAQSQNAYLNQLVGAYNAKLERYGRLTR